MSYEIGTTVLAMRDGDTERLFVYGEGVYVGDRLMPGTSNEPPTLDYEAITAVLTEDDSVPIEEHRFLVWYDEWVRTGVEVRQSREQVIDQISGDRSRPMDERVNEIYRKTRMNPCIYLDSGDIVFGFQCWWGPLERANDRFPDAERVLVPVPEGNGRWK